MHVKKGDLVKIIAGKERELGPARILRVLPEENRVVVEGRNLVKKHIRGNAQLNTESRIMEVEAPIYACKVALYSEKLGRTVRTQVRWVGEGGTLHRSEKEARASFASAPERIKKVRYSPKSDETFE